MASRSTLFLLPVALSLLSPGVFGQVAAPPDVDQALRARVAEFFQDFVDGKFRQAINFVAEDTQDEYFASPKIDMKSFKIEGIDYAGDFSKANVKLKVNQLWKMKAEGFVSDTVVETPMETDWKIENGKWVWYHPAKTSGWVTPMGASADLKPQAATSVPKKFDTQTMDQEALKILGQNPTVNTGLNQKEVTLSTDQPSSAKVIFHNGAPGSFTLFLMDVPKMPGLTATLDKQNVNAGEDAIIDLHYDPPADKAEPSAFSLRVDVAPFDAQFPLYVKFAASKQ